MGQAWEPLIASLDGGGSSPALVAASLFRPLWPHRETPHSSTLSITPSLLHGSRRAGGLIGGDSRMPSNVDLFLSWRQLTGGACGY